MYYRKVHKVKLNSEYQELFSHFPSEKQFDGKHGLSAICEPNFGD